MSWPGIPPKMRTDMTVFEGRFKNRAAIVTGGASGLGKETAQRLSREGAKVVLWDVNAEALDKVKAEIGATGTIALDLSDHGAVAKAAADSAQLLGHIDILINSARSTGATGPGHEYPLDSWKRV